MNHLLVRSQLAKVNILLAVQSFLLALVLATFAYFYVVFGRAQTDLEQFQSSLCPQRLLSAPQFSSKGFVVVAKRRSATNVPQADHVPETESRSLVQSDSVTDQKRDDGQRSSSSMAGRPAGSDQRQKKRDVTRADSKVDEWNWVLLSATSKISKTLLFQYCITVKQHCMLKKRKFRGAPGPRGITGVKGILGVIGEEGPVGWQGSPGLPGEPGNRGQNGTDGTCSCTLEDMLLLFPSTVSTQTTNVTTELTTEQPKVPTAPTTSPAYFEESVHAEILGFNKRKCLLDAVGTPVFHSESQFGQEGTWMRDAILVDDEDVSSRRWVFDGYLSPVLYEYRNELDLLYKKQSAKYFLDYSATGTGAIIFNGSFYYHRYGSPNIVRYDLNSTDEMQRPLPNVAYQDCTRIVNVHDNGDDSWNCSANTSAKYLYGLPHNFVDFAADENGVWVVYSNTVNNSLTAAKIRTATLEVIHQWFIDVPTNMTVANTFIMCGVLYGLKSATDYDTEINFAFDLYNDAFINVTVGFRNPFQQTTMLDYNPIDRRLYYFDHGNLLTVPVRTKRGP